MNHTKNYGLPQWELNDLIRMEDFNRAMTSIESGLDSNAAAANEAKADAASAKIVANTAKTTADTALAAKPYVVGSYTGTGAEMTINLGFRPSFVIVSGLRETMATNSTTDFDRYFGMSAGNIMTHRLAFTDKGFVVFPSNLLNYYYPDYTDKGRRYDYIAFK